MMRVKRFVRVREFSYTGATVVLSLAMGFVTSVRAQPYSFAVAKSRVFLQTNAAPPILDYDRPFMFQAQVYREYIFLYASSVSLHPPGKAPISMDLVSLDVFLHGTNYDNQAQMDEAFPNGSYWCEVFDSGGTQLHVPLGADAYPLPPTISNYGEAQGISAVEDFTVLFPAWGGTAISNIVSLLVVEPTPLGQVEIYRTSILAQAATNGISIPGNTLETGKTYYGALQFLSTTAVSNTSSGDLSSANYASLTQFTLRTPAQPLLRIYGSPPGPLHVRFNSNPGTTYHLLGSTNLVDWADRQTLNATRGYEKFDVAPAVVCEFFSVAHD